VENRGTHLVLLLCLIAMPAEARFRNPFSKPPASASTAQNSGELPFRLVHSSLVVATGSLNGVPAHHLLIDTGTNPTVLDVAVARKLGVQGKTSDLRTLGGGIPGTSGILSTVGLGPILARSVPVFVADLSFMKQDLGENIDAVIGLDVLKAETFTIDYERRRIVFGPAPQSPNWVPFAGGPPMITVETQIDGQTKRLLVDTGAEGLFLFEGEKDATLTPTARNGSHFSLIRNREQVEIPDMRLGSLRRSRQSASIVRTQDPSLREFDGLLGLSALGIRQVVFDFERRQLGWR
jgi:predicted aspartyl protease